MSDSGKGGGTPSDSARLDRWLLAARVYKTRPLCAAACDGGKVDVNGSAATPHKLVRVGDRIQATTEGGRRQLVVRALGLRRLSAPDARELYEDVTPPPTPEEIARRQIERLEYRDPGAGRPTKRDRRDMRRLRGGR